ncbi:MAG: SPFH domain-containing protein [Xanthomonadales bacterium]|nr:SPFH domain-containing protein [Xanthomonadales bacterium]
MNPALLLVVVALGLALSTAILSIRRVPDGQVLAVRRLGRFERVLTPGLRLFLPLLDREVRRISLVGHSLRLERRLIAAADLRPVAVEGTVFFQFLDPQRAGQGCHAAHQRVAAELSRLLAELGRDYSGEALAAARGSAALLGSLKRSLNRALAADGVLVTRLQLDFAPLPA